MQVPIGNKLYRTPNGNAVFVTRDGHVTLTNQSKLLKENQLKFVNEESKKNSEHASHRFVVRVNMFTSFGQS